MWEWLPLLALVAGFSGESLQLQKILKKRHYSGVSRFKYVIAISMSLLFTTYFCLVGIWNVALLYGAYTLIKIIILIVCLRLKALRKRKKFNRNVTCQ